MSETGKHLYRITQTNDSSWRVIWNGNFVDAYPAEKAENLFIELNRHRAFESSSLVELDLTHCAIVNSAGLAFLIYFRRRLHTNGNRLVLSNVPLLLQRMLLMLNLDSAFESLARHAVDHADEEVLFQGLVPELGDEMEEMQLTVDGPIHTPHENES